MLRMLVPMVGLGLVLSAHAQPVTLKTKAGAVFTDAMLSRVEPDGVVLVTDSGIKKVFFTEMNPEDQQRYGYDPGAALEFSTRQREAQRAHHAEAEKHRQLQEEQEHQLRQETAARQESAREVQAKPPVRLEGKSLGLVAEGTLVLAPTEAERTESRRKAAERRRAQNEEIKARTGSSPLSAVGGGYGPAVDKTPRPDVYFEGKAILAGVQREFGSVSASAKQVGWAQVEGEEVPVFREVVPKINSLSGKVDGWVFK